MKGGSRLIVFESFHDRTIDDHLMILQLSAHHPERVVLLMVVDLHLAQSRRTARRHPFLGHIIVHHYRCPSTNYALFTVEEKEGNKTRDYRTLQELIEYLYNQMHFYNTEKTVESYIKSSLAPNLVPCLFDSLLPAFDVS